MSSEYWYWEKAIPKEVCEAMLKEVEKLNLVVGEVNGKNNTNVVSIEIRNNEVHFLPENHWFEGILLNHVRYANASANWNFSITGNEPVQVTSYTEGQKYEWHEDTSLLDKTKEYQRKLTTVCQLSDTSDFTGGGLFLKDIEDSILKNQGDIVVFPSFLSHKAAEVTSGNRVTLVCWVTGEYFR
jgi:PKHD-type hydroxylase